MFAYENLQDTLDSSVRHAEASMKFLVAAVSGEEIKRSRRDGDSYNYQGRPEDAITQNFQGYIEAKAAAKAAKSILKLVGQQVEGVVLDVLGATKLYVDLYTAEQRYSSSLFRSSNAIDNVVRLYEHEATLKFVGDLREKIAYAEEKLLARKERESERIAFYVSHKTNLTEAEQALAVVLTDAKLRSALDPMADEQATTALVGLTPEEIADEVDALEALEAEQRAVENARRETERQEKQAKQCCGNVRGEWRSSRCTKNGKYKVTFEDGTTALMCGTHIKTGHGRLKQPAQPGHALSLHKEGASFGETKTVKSVEEVSA